MAITFTFNFGTGAQGTSVPVNLKPWNYSTTYRIISDNGKIARMTDILSPLDLPTTLKVTVDPIANVYSTLANGTTVPLAQQSLNVMGHTVMSELSSFLTKTDAAGVVTYKPWVARSIIRLPDDPDITGNMVIEMMLASLAGLADSTGACNVLTEKMRGALTPAGI